MYIGGAQKRPDGNYSYTVIGADGQSLGQVGDGSRKDIRDAVEAAHKVSSGWGKRAAHNRAQILYYIAGMRGVPQEMLLYWYLTDCCSDSCSRCRKSFNSRSRVCSSTSSDVR